MGTVTVDDGHSRIFWSAWLNTGYGKDWIKVEARFDARKVNDEDRQMILDVIDYAKGRVEHARAMAEAAKQTVVQG